MRISGLDRSNLKYFGAGLDQNNRAPGIHVSDILRSLGTALRIIPRRDTNTDTVDKNDLFEMGFIWEHALEMAFKDRMATRPGEVTLDEITGSPDGVNFEENGSPYLEEYKLTWTSCNKDIASNWYWMMQMKCYCKMLNLTRVVLRVMWVNGNYKPMLAVYAAYEIEFTEAEVEEAWQQVISYKPEFLRKKEAESHV